MPDIDNASHVNAPRPGVPGAEVGKEPKNGRLVAMSLSMGVLLGFGFAWWYLQSRAVAFKTPYQAVLLSNGAVYYGKLQGYGTSTPVLTEVFYIVTQTDTATKQVSNVLVKRGKELHGPDRMYLNSNLIVLVEPVGQSSKVAQLIATSP
jgi:hypothetical protein